MEKAKSNNTLIRVLVALVGIPLIIAVCYFGSIFFLLFASAIGLICYYEFSSMLKNKESYPNLTLGYLSILLLVFNSYYNFIDFTTLLLIMIPLIFISELFRNKSSAVSNTGSTLLGIFYFGLFTSSIVLIREFFSYSDLLYFQGGYLIIAILATIWMCDSAAFFLGTALGKHKLFPRVSPNKSWEGAIGGFVFSVITMLAMKALMIDFLEWRDVIIIGMIVGIFGQIGDLVESLIKRDTNTKDSSSILPGHGGIFDRFDSFLFSSPIIYLYLKNFIQ
jgi:phosphatidate cytidylyltransferase